MEKRVKISSGEAKILTDYFQRIESAKRDLTIAAGMILAREEIRVAVVDDVVGDELILTIPDEEVT